MGNTPQDISLIQNQLESLRFAIKSTQDQETYDYDKTRIFRKQVLKSNPSTTKTEVDNLTIEENDTPDGAIEGKLQVFGSDTVQAGSTSIPTLGGPNEGGAPASIEWIEIDGDSASGVGQSLATRQEEIGELTITKLEIKDFFDPPEATLNEGDKVILRVDSANPVPEYATKAQMQEWLDIPVVDDKTVELKAIDQEPEKLQLVNADEVASDAVSIPTLSGPSSGAVELTWVKIDGSEVQGTGKSLAIRTDTLEINGFLDGSNGSTGDLNEGDKIVMRSDSTDPVPIYATKAQIQAWIGTSESSEPWMCGYILSGGNVTLTSGYVFWGGKTLTVSASGPNAVSNGDCWGLEVTMSSASWVSAASATAFQDTEDTLYCFYYQFGLDGDGNAYIAAVGQKGNWKIPGVFAAE